MCNLAPDANAAWRAGVLSNQNQLYQHKYQVQTNLSTNFSLRFGIKDVPIHIVKKMTDKGMKETLELFDYRRHQEYKQSLRWELKDDSGY